MTLSTWLALAGFLLLFLGERTFGDSGTARLVLDLLGLAGLVGALVLRYQRLQAAPPEARRAHHLAAAFLGVALGGLLVYALGLDAVTSALGLSDEGANRWHVVCSALWPILVAAGLLPLVWLDRAIEDSPLAPHPLRVQQAAENGLSLALALALLFPLNYLGKEFNHRWDLTYFHTAMPGSSTQALVANLEKPVRAVLFFPPANEVAEEVLPYFEALEGPNLSVELVDHAMEPELAKELKVRDNGVIALVQGEGDEQQVETVKLDTKFDRAKHKLKKLDSEVQKALLALSHGKRVAYFTTGHGELEWRGAHEKTEKISLLKKLLEALNFKVRTLGVGEGLATEVPDDATVVFVVGPRTAFLEEEAATLKRYVDGGGHLFVALEPELGPEEATAAVQRPFEAEPLLSPLGLSYEPHPLVTDDPKTYLPVTGGKIDRLNLGTNRYSSHPSMTTLSRNSRVAWMIFSGAGPLTEIKDHRGKVTITVRSPSRAWVDLDDDFEHDPKSETRKVYNIAAVASGPSTEEGEEYRAVVVGDATFLSDFYLPNKANAQFVVDAVHWLAGEEELAGTVNDEEDVKIVHDKEGQGIWFYGTTFLVPLLIGGVGLFRVRRRKKGVEA